jgi:hypothetical protein
MKFTVKPLLVLPLVVLLATLALSACVGAGVAANKPTGMPDNCLEEISGAKSLVNKEHGYCLLYPEGYDIFQPNPDEIVLAIGSLLDVEHPRVYIDMTDPAGLDVVQAADQLTADFPGFNIWRSDDLIIDGESAVVLDQVPGQDLSRQVMVLHANRLYKLVFVPSDESLGDVYNQMKLMYQTVTNSFRFID